MSMPGWYPDQVDPSVRRYWTGTAWGPASRWDGVQWVDAGAPIAPAATWGVPAAQAAGPATSTARPPRRVAARAYVAVGGAALVVLGCLLPWASQSNGFTTTTITGTSAGGGEVDLVLGLLSLVLLGVVLAAGGGTRALWATVAASALALVVCLANLANLADVIKKEKAADTTSLLGSSAGTKPGFGIVLVLIGSVVALVATLLTLAARRRARRVPS